MLREFKIVRMNKQGELVNDYEMFSTLERAEAWGDEQNTKVPGSVVDIELMDCNEELKYEY